MKFNFIVLGLVLGLISVPASAQTAKPREFEGAHPWGAELSLKFRAGDDPAWARRDWDETDWAPIGRRDLPARSGIYWLRTRVTLPAREAARPIDALAVAIVASYELFWDGHLLGRSGVVGADRTSEVPGNLDQIFSIPESMLEPGEHVIALRLSSFHTGFPSETYGLYLGLTTQRDYFTARSRAAAFATVAMGAACVLGVLLLFVGLLVQRRPAPVLFGLVCLSAALVQALQAWRALFHYSYEWHFPRLVAQIASVALLGLLLVAFVAVFFRAKRPAMWVAGLAAISVVIVRANFFESNPMLEALWWCILLEAAAISAWALWCGERRAAFVLGGLLVSGVILARDPVAFREQSFLHGMGSTMLGCTIALTLQLRADRLAARQAQLTAARLEIELLKKNIQPHFLLNTLTTLSEVIEQEPKVAVTLIEALAAEFRLLARMSGERLVPLRQELDLCREHLRVMSLRQDVRYSLRTENVPEETPVPPALILTLVENGLTHTRARGGAVEFILRGKRAGDLLELSFLAPTSLPAPSTATGVARRSSPPSPAAVAAGTGSRYIKARLTESFGDAWTLTSQPTPHGWETVIRFKPVRGPGELGVDLSRPS